MTTASLMEDLRDRVVLVACETSTLRSAIAERLRAAGARLAVVVHKSWQVDEVRGQLGRDGVFVGAVGPRDAEAAAGFAKGVEDALGPIVAMVLVGSRSGGGARVGEDAEDELTQLLLHNLFASANLVRATIGRMRRRSRGRIVFVGCEQAGDRSANVAASEAGLRGYVLGLAAELEGSGVTAVGVLDRSGLQGVDKVADEVMETLAGA